MNEDCRCSSPPSDRPGRSSAAGDLRDAEPNDSFTRLQSLRRFPAGDLRLDESGRKRKSSRLEGEAERTPGRVPTCSAPGGNDGQNDCKKLPGSSSIAVRPLDSRRCPTVARTKIRNEGFGVDGREVFASLGSDSTETRTPRIRTGPRSGSSLAENPLSRDSRKSPKGARGDTLGRRNGSSVGSSIRTLVWAARADSDRARDRAKVPVQRDFNSDQSRQVGLHGIRRLMHRRPVPVIFASPHSAHASEDISHRRQPLGSSGPSGERMGFTAFETNTDFLSSALQSGAQPG